MSVREYIGARYVPIFGRKDESSIEWDDTKPYEPLTIVLYQGNSYTSRQYVPAGIPITNETYWALTGNYNAQVEAYRNEVQGFRDDIDQNTEDIATINGEIGTGFTPDNTVRDEITSANDAIDSVSDVIGTGFSPTNTIRDEIDAISATTGIAKTEMVIIGDSYSTTGYDALANELWWVKVAQQLDLTPHNFAVGGTGYNDPSTPNFYTQVENAASDTSFNNDQVKYVFIFGGRNDYNYMTNLQSTIISVVERAKSLFPKSQIILMGVNTWISFTVASASQCDWAIQRDIYSAAIQTGVTFINTLDWLVGQSSYFGGNSHPNASGQMCIATKVLSALNGTPATIFRQLHCTSSTTDPYNNLLVTNTNGNWILTGITDLNSNGEAIITIPNKIGMLTGGLTMTGGLTNSTHTNVYGQVDFPNSKITLHGEANARVTLYMPFAWSSC